MSGLEFESGRAYEHVFLIFIDAAGHSSVVVNNPSDLVYRAMDLLQERLRTRLRTIAERHRCGRAFVWRWSGDGGFVVVHDEDESIARDTAVEFVRTILELDLNHLRDEFQRWGIRGELHVRVAMHRGTIQYRGAGLEGSIYSPDINFAAHLEKVTPPDTVAVSAEVKQVAGGFADVLEHVGTFEDRPVYVFAPHLRPPGARRAWLAARGMTGSTLVHALHERPSQRDKATLIDVATEEVLDLGTSLRTAGHYLVTTERPAYFRDAVLGLLRRGGRYRCVLMNPAAAATDLVARQRRELLVPKIEQSLADLARFRASAGSDGERVEVYLTSEYPAMACLTADVDEDVGLILASPYLATPPGEDTLERGDMPHYLVSRSAGELYDKLHRQVVRFCRSHNERVL
jgi:class 3 adenylate cyclase